jgi:2-polyprenyl-6-methoxyphenol hydroxylase-like FAD-dependent oxidoreductase
MSKTYDVAIVGYGPTGMTLAALLGQQGYEVLVLERYPGLYNLPRAACFDDEIMRTFQKLGITAEVEPGTLIQHEYEWVNGKGETLVEIEYDDPAPAGWPALYMMYQPDIEDALDGLCKSLPSVEIRRGLSVESIEPDADGVTIHAAGVTGITPEGVIADGEPVTARARWLIGADGGRGLIRTAMDIGYSTYNFEENWLVCDFERKGDLDWVPDMRQVCDPVQPIAIVRIGPKHHRFSFMLEPDEDVGVATDPDRVWSRVAEYITPNDADLIRVANYVFRSRITDRWREGRVIVAGDAAHEMPPFLAQGMCSGMRDAHNIAWKLDLVFRGLASADLLDTYQPEREPHVRFITEKAIELGRVQTMRDPVKARERDERMLAARRANQAPEKLRFPALTGGLVAVVDSPHGGEFFVQGRVRVNGREDRFDDLVGTGPCIVARGDALPGLEPGQREKWAKLGGHLAWIDPGDGVVTDGAVAAEDIDGTYAAWFDAHDCDAVVVRPDWYLFGSATGAGELADLVARILGALRTSDVG